MFERTTLRLVKLLVAAMLCALAASPAADAQASRSHARTSRRQTRPRTTSRGAPPAQTTGQTPASSLEQTHAPSTGRTADPTRPVPEDDADLAITAHVTAKELKFDAVPNPNVEFPGQPRRETEWSAERTNLPPQVQPGVTYRDIGIRLKIVSRFADIDRIVAEALGEIPTSDDAAPPPRSSDAQPPAARRDDLQPSATRANVTRQPAASRKPRARGAGRSR
jgi:hypothetical protein